MARANPFCRAVFAVPNNSATGTMDSWYPYVIGAVAFFYVQSFNRIARVYLESGKTLAWSDFFTVVMPIVGARD
jgi:hypothetical protein